MPQTIDRISKRGRVNEGRPTKYQPGFCRTVIRLGKQGKSRCQIALFFNVENETLIEWEKRHVEFSVAMKSAREFSRGWWENQGQDGIWDSIEGEGENRVVKRMNAQVYRLNMINRFPDHWQDRTRTEITGAGGGPVQVERLNILALRAEVERLEAQIATPQETLQIEAEKEPLVSEIPTNEAETGAKTPQEKTISPKPLE